MNGRLVYGSHCKQGILREGKDYSRRLELECVSDCIALPSYYRKTRAWEDTLKPVVWGRDHPQSDSKLFLSSSGC